MADTLEEAVREQRRIQAKYATDRTYYVDRYAKPPQLGQTQMEAIAAYWAAQTPEQERVAYQRMMELGLPDSYGIAYG